jgi:hypothetical protein
LRLWPGFLTPAICGWNGTQDVRAAYCQVKGKAWASGTKCGIPMADK